MKCLENMTNVELALYYANIGDRDALVELSNRDEPLKPEEALIGTDKRQLVFDFAVASS